MRFRKMSHWKILAVVVIVVVVLSLLIPSTVTQCRQWHCCALCRLTRIDYDNIVGNHWSKFEETDCSQWYAANIEPDHEHVWVRSTSRGYLNVLGKPVAVADSDRPVGITKWTSAEQIALYAHVPASDEIQPVLVAIRDDAESGDEARYPNVRDRAGVISKWIDSSFAKPWGDVKTELAAASNSAP